MGIYKTQWEFIRPFSKGPNARPIKHPKLWIIE